MIMHDVAGRVLDYANACRDYEVVLLRDEHIKNITLIICTFGRVDMTTSLGHIKVERKIEKKIPSKTEEAIPAAQPAETPIEEGTTCDNCGWSLWSQIPFTATMVLCPKCKADPDRDIGKNFDTDSGLYEW